MAGRFIGVLVDNGVAGEVVMKKNVVNLELKNRTDVFKNGINLLEKLNEHDFADTQQLFSTVKMLLEAGKGLDKSINDAREQMKIQFIGQKEKYLELIGSAIADEKVKKDLGISMLEIEEVVSERGDKDFDKIICICEKTMNHQHKKAALFSKKRKELKDCLKSILVLKGNFDKWLDLYSDVGNKIKIHLVKNKLKEGDLSFVPEISGVTILLKKDEKCYFKADDIDLYEDRSVRDTVGGYDGFSFRIAKGISYRIGGFSAKGESHMEKRLIDKGTFYITNKRYIFDGAVKNIEGDLKKVISVEAYSDGIKISRSNKRDEVYAGNMDGEYVGAVVSCLVKNI